MNNLLQILQQAGVPYRLPPDKYVRAGWVGIPCPKCAPDSGKFRLGIELDSGRSHCWVCGSFYTPEILALVLRKSQREVHELIGKLPRHRVAEPTERHGVLTPPAGIGDLSAGHRAYLIGRGLDPDEISRVWGVRGIGHAPRLKWRLYIPIHNRTGRVVSWTTRSIAPETERRYWAADESEEEVYHKSLLYGAHLARHVIIIVEGPIDAWAIGPGAVATCGVGFTAQQKALMADYPVRVVLFDAEPDAQRRAEALCEDLCLIPGRTENLLLETGNDPADADRAEVAEIRRRYFPEIYAAAA